MPASTDPPVKTSQPCSLCCPRGGMPPKLVDAFSPPLPPTPYITLASSFSSVPPTWMVMPSCVCRAPIFLFRPSRQPPTACLCNKRFMCPCTRTITAPILSLLAPTRSLPRFRLACFRVAPENRPHACPVLDLLCCVKELGLSLATRFTFAFLLVRNIGYTPHARHKSHCQTYRVRYIKALLSPHLYNIFHGLLL